MTQETQEFSNEDYSVAVKKEAGCNVRFDITIKPERAQKARKKALKEVAKKISIPGFRKGKAPEDLITEKYGSQVESKWRDEIANSAFNEVVQLTEIFPYNNDSIKNGKLESLTAAEGGKLWVEFISRPDIPSVDMSQIKVEKVTPKAVTEKEIDQVIEDIRYQHANWEPMDSRAVEEGDFVDVDIENLDQPGNYVCEDTRIEVKQKKIGDWLLKALIGKMRGESAEATSELDPSADPTHFKPTHCKVTVKGIFSCILPEVDDELAKKVGVQQATELKERIAKDLEMNSERDAHEKMRDALRKAVVQANPFEIPESLVQENVQRILSARGRALLERAESDPQAKETLEKMQRDIALEIKEVFRWQFLVQKLASEQQFDIPKQEIIGELLQMRFAQNGDYGEERQEELYERAVGKLLDKKVADYLIEKAAKA